MGILITFTILWTVSFSSAAKETTIRYQFSGVVGRTETSNTLTIDGVPITWSDSQDNGFLSVNTECEAPFRMTLMLITRSFNHTHASKHTYQRTRECVLEGLRVLQVSDRIYYDGAEYLSLDSAANTWTAAVPEALALKQQWDLHNGCTERHKIHLQDGCIGLVKAFSHNNSGNIWISILVVGVIVIFLCQIMVSFFISMRGLIQPGGVLGSIGHYHQRNGDDPGDAGEDDLALHSHRE